MNGPLLSPGEVSTRLGVSRQTLRRWRETGRGPTFMQVNALVRYMPESVAAYERGDIKE